MPRIKIKLNRIVYFLLGCSAMLGAFLLDIHLTFPTSGSAVL